MKKVLLAALDPVHDNAVKLLNRKLSELGYQTIILPPGVHENEVIERAVQEQPAAILISRTLGYQVAEILGRLVDLAEAAGLREHTLLGVGGMAITRELGAELGFDATFTGELDIEEVVAFIEGKYLAENRQKIRFRHEKPDITGGYTYQFKDPRIEHLLDQITDQILEWVKGKTTPAIERAKIRLAFLEEEGGNFLDSNHKRAGEYLERYLKWCGPQVQAFYREGKLPEGVRRLNAAEVAKLMARLKQTDCDSPRLPPGGGKPLVFVQYGTGCPLMDSIHIKTVEAWGADGVLHFDPSWGAQQEGLLEGWLSHQHDGTILTLENLRLIRSAMQPTTLWNVRGHRGLNTPEVQILAATAGADLLKINIPYGATAGGSDPARLTVDGVYSLRLAAQYGLPFDIPGNDELSGVPPHKTFAGMLVMVMLGLKLGAKPIPKPLLCYSPYMQIEGQMEDNYVDMNTAKLEVWREIVDAPLWPGEPVGFMTHTADRIQSAVTTAAHVALAASLGVDAVTMASSDEAYSKGAISAAARVDTLRAVRDMLRFMGNSRFQATPRAALIQEQLRNEVIAVLEKVAQRGDFVAAIHEGLFGNQQDGLYAGRVGRDTVMIA
ncbi:MAG: cobalamin-dependent protein [Chloroflexota bacterium]